MPLLPVRIVADYLLFEALPVPLYDMDPQLANEVREVIRIYRQLQAEQMKAASRRRDTGVD